MADDACQWCGSDGVMVAARFGGDPGGFLSWFSARFPTPVLTGLAGDPRCGHGMLCSAAVIGKAGGVGDSRRGWIPDGVADGGELPVSASTVRPSLGSWVFMNTHFSVAFISFSLLLRLVCVFIYFYCSRIIRLGYFDCYSHAVGTDQLVWVWVWVDGGSPAVVILSTRGGIVRYNYDMGTDQLMWVCAEEGGPAVVILSTQVWTVSYSLASYECRPVGVGLCRRWRSSGGNTTGYRPVGVGLCRRWRSGGGNTVGKLVLDCV